MDDILILAGQFLEFLAIFFRKVPVDQIPHFESTALIALKKRGEHNTTIRGIVIVGGTEDVDVSKLCGHIFLVL